MAAPSCYLLLRVERDQNVRLLATRQPPDPNLKITPEMGLLYNAEGEDLGLVEGLLNFLRPRRSLEIAPLEIVIAPGVLHDTEFTRALLEQGRELEKELARRARNEHVLLDALRRLRRELLGREGPKPLERRKRKGPIIVWATDARGICTYVNRAWELFSGHVGKADLDRSWEAAIHPADRPEVIAAYRQACAAHERYAAEYRLRRADGEYRWVRSEAEPNITAYVGEFLGYIGTTCEIEMRRSEIEVKRKTVMAETRAPLMVRTATA